MMAPQVTSSSGRCLHTVTTPTPGDTLPQAPSAPGGSCTTCSAPDQCCHVSPGASQAQPVNGALPSMPSPTMQNFNIAPQPGPNSQPGGSEGAVFANGLPQTFAARKNFSKNFPPTVFLLMLLAYYIYTGALPWSL